MNRNMNSERRSWRNKNVQNASTASLISCVQVLLFVISLAARNGIVLAQESTPSAASYAQNCALCHGDDGTGAMPGTPDLLAKTVWANDTDAVLLTRIRQGITTPGSQTGMPPNAGNPELSEHDLLLAIQYLRSLLAAGK